MNCTNCDSSIYQSNCNGFIDSIKAEKHEVIQRRHNEFIEKFKSENPIANEILKHIKNTEIKEISFAGSGYFDKKGKFYNKIPKSNMNDGFVFEDDFNGFFKYKVVRLMTVHCSDRTYLYKRIMTFNM